MSDKDSITDSDEYSVDGGRGRHLSGRLSDRGAGPAQGPASMGRTDGSDRSSQEGRSADDPSAGGLSADTAYEAGASPDAPASPASAAGQQTDDPAGTADAGTAGTAPSQSGAQPHGGQGRLERFASEEPWDGKDPLASLGDLGESFDLANAHPTGVARLLASGQVTLAGLFHEPADLTASERSLSRLEAQADADRLAYGFGQIQLAVGVARWAQDRYEVPVLLFPVRLGADEGRRLARRPLYVEQQPLINPRFVSMLRSRSILIDPQAMLVDARGRDGSLDTTVLLDAVSAAARRHIADFTIDRRYIFGCFIDPASAIVRRARDIASSASPAPLIGPGGTVDGGYRHTRVVLALAGDHEAVSALRGQDLSQVDAADPDPHEEREAGDVPARVRKAARAASDGASFLLDTAGGLASVAPALAVASRAAADGRRVLVVPDGPRQKQEFLRLARQTGIAPMVLDLADHQAGQGVDRQFVDSLSPETGRSTAVTDFNRTADELVGVRSRLDSYFDSLHTPVRPWDVSAYQSIEQLASVSALPSKPRTRVRLSQESAKNLRGRLETTGRTLVRLGELGEYTLRPSDTPWYGARLYTNEEAQEAQERVRRLLDKTLPTVREQLSRTVRTCGFVVAQSVEEWGSQISVLQSLRRVLDLFRPEIFDQDLKTALDATLTRKQRAQAGVRMGFWARRRAIRDVRHCLHPGQKPENLHDTLEVVARQGERWRKLVPSGGWPVLPDGLDEIVATFEQMNQDLTALDAVLVTAPGTRPLAESTFVDVDTRLRALYADRDRLTDLPELMRLDRQMRKEGLSDLLADLIDRHVDAQAAPDELRLAWWTTVFESIVHASRTIADQDDAVLREAVERFRTVDRRHVATIGPLLLKENRRRLSELLYRHSHDANQLHDLLRRETDVPASRLLREWPTLTWAAKPIVVATAARLALEPVGGHTADLVVLSGATHMPSAEMLVALEAADSCVLVAHQDALTGGAAVRLASILPTVRVGQEPVDMPTPLAAFLARRGQGVRLMPGAGTASGKIRLVRVEAKGVPSGRSGLVESSSAEVEEVTRRVIATAVERGRQAGTHAVRPLTVFTLNDYDAGLLRRSLDRAARKSSDLRSFLPSVLVTTVAHSAGAPVGDVLLSVGFAPTMHGVLLQQFGLLEQEGGDRLLLDALGLTGGDLTIVSSFASSDMQDARLHEAGPRLLKMLLRWAESLGVTNGGAGQHPDQEGVLMRDLAHRLRVRGVQAAVGYGFKDGLCLPLAVGTPRLGYRWAVMTDNARFMGEKSLRDRFRLLPGRLERHGWHVLTAWSVGTFINPDAVVDGIVSAIGPENIPSPSSGAQMSAGQDAVSSDAVSSGGPVSSDQASDQAAHGTGESSDAVRGDGGFGAGKGTGTVAGTTGAQGSISDLLAGHEGPLPQAPAPKAHD